MASSIENFKKIKDIKKTVRTRFPWFWEQFIRYAWEARVKLPLLEPMLFSQIRKVGKGLASYRPESGGKKVLFFQTRSNAPHLSWAGTLALALSARGHQAKFFGCGGELFHACNNANYPEGLSESRCRICYISTRRFFELSGIETTWMSGYLDSSDIERAENMVNTLKACEYESFEYRSYPLGQIARHSVAHFLRTGSIGDDSLSREVYRKFLINSILVADASIKLMDEYDPDVVLMLCGLFMPEHVMMDIARSRGKRVVVYEIAMLAQDALMMQHDRPIDYDDRENWERFKSLPLTVEENATLDNYLFERSQGRMSVVNYWPEKEEDERNIRESLGINSDKRTAVLFPNITWDSALFEKDIAFKGMFDWLDRTFDFFAAHPEYQLIVRAHPAEVILPGSLRESVISYITGKYPALPANIILVAPESKISSYSLMDMSHCGLSYASTTAIELGIRGIPTLVAGEVHFRRKGFTIDIDDASTYHSLLDETMKGNASLSRAEIIEMARRYAYFTFYRTSMPFNKIHCGAGDQPVLTYDDISSLAPGNDKSLDIICSGIISGTPFIFE